MDGSTNSIRYPAEHHGSFEPPELDLINRVLTRLGLANLDVTAREALAQRVMANYVNGITNEDELVAVSDTRRI